MSTLNDDLHWAHPLVRDWFQSQVGLPTEPQRAGWPSILASQATLISAPTGSGKTFAAFLVCIDQLVRKAISGTLEDQTEVLYVSPLKALSHDIQKNLNEPLRAIRELAEARGIFMQEIRVAVRTGDTLAKERLGMIKKPPHILVTTPESFYILLTAEKSRAMLRDVKTVIVDEIHALADDKRGSHLALSLERLEVLVKNSPLRIGLSATQKPIESVAQFLMGARRSLPTIINIGHQRQLDIAIEVPGDELGAVASNELWDDIYNRVTELAQQHRSTLVFVNTRRLAERVAHHLRERLGPDQVAAHHGSLSRKLRLATETKLKNGELKVLVATASLELGIDIGSVDLVCQLGSTRSIAVALQRIGRAGHWHGAIPKGRIFATTRDELVECAALVYAVNKGDLDQLIIPEQALDILAQQIIATCATGEWQIEALFNLCRAAYPYRDLSRTTFAAIIKILSEGIAGSRSRYGAYLFYDQVNQRVSARRGSRLIAILNGGAIPENGLFTVLAEPNGTVVGTLDEDFAVESNRGDIILLGTTSWQIRRIESARGQVLVEDAHGAPPSVPFWRGEAPARTKELSYYVAYLREKINEFLDKNATLIWLKENCKLDQSGAEQLIDYIAQARAVLGAIPTQKIIVAERFFDEGGGMQLIIHAPFGARINKAWGLALRKKFCRSFNFELQAAATDNGINIALTEQHSFPLADVFKFLHPNTLEETLVQAVLQSPLFATRWRWVSTRSLAVKRFNHGKKTPPNILRMLSDDLLAAVFPDAAACQDNLAGRDIALPDHPLINEALKDALQEALDIDGLMEVIKDILNEKIICLAVDTPTPSVFAHEILNANPYAYLDDAPLEERRARAVEMRRILPQTHLAEIGKLNPDVIKEVQEQAWPDIRDADELHDFLQTIIALPIENKYLDFFAKLNSTQRAALALYKEKKFWVCAEKLKTFKNIYPEAVFAQTCADIEENPLEYNIAILEMLKGWLLHTGPITQEELNEKLALSASDIQAALLKLESTGFILRGHFRDIASDQLEWCERRLLARIHRLTLGSLRKEIAPVTAGEFSAWLLKWQHLVPATQLQGEQGLIEIIRQLQGFEIPANAWEKKIFAKRIADYHSDMLDHLCFSGVVGWGRLSPHAALQHDGENPKRIQASSVVPITFFIRDETNWMSPHDYSAIEELNGLSHVAKNIYHYLKKNGASFFVDIVRGTDHLKAEVENGLWELVAAGLLTADGFDNLRALLDPKRRLHKNRRGKLMRFSSGRWALFRREEKVSSEYLEAVCRMLLKRYGVVFRDLLAREKNLPRWRELLITFRRLEDRGEIRGGRFVSGFLGEQFALPYAVESLRLSRKEVQNETLLLASADPLNLVGIILPGERISPLSKQKIELRY